MKKIFLLFLFLQSNIFANEVEIEKCLKLLDKPWKKAKLDKTRWDHLWDKLDERYSEQVDNNDEVRKLDIFRYENNKTDTEYALKDAGDSFVLALKQPNPYEDEVHELHREFRQSCKRKSRLNDSCKDLKRKIVEVTRKRNNDYKVESKDHRLKRSSLKTMSHNINSLIQDITKLRKKLHRCEAYLTIYRGRKSLKSCKTFRGSGHGRISIRYEALVDAIYTTLSTTSLFMKYKFTPLKKNSSEYVKNMWDNVVEQSKYVDYKKGIRPVVLEFDMNSFIEPVSNEIKQQVLSCREVLAP